MRFPLKPKPDLESLPLGTQKLVKKFAWLPVKCQEGSHIDNTSWVWLESYNALYTLCIGYRKHWDGPRHYWCPAGKYTI